MCLDQSVSPSSRRAWIEILERAQQGQPITRRPPRGGRGLKSAVDKVREGLIVVALLAEGVD